jgi:hypothetical protein
MGHDSSHALIQGKVPESARLWKKRMHFVREKRDKPPPAGAFMRDEGGELFERSIESREPA